MENELDNSSNFTVTCPVPIFSYPHIILAHGGGGKLTHQLIESIFIPQFNNTFLQEQHDGAVFDSPGKRLAMTTDSYVIRPIFFPGGNIGTLAVNGTVNDLAMCGAAPKYLSCGFIIEEGLAVDDLWRIAVSMKEAAEKAGVMIVTGDTKVVERGKGDKIFINTTGIGSIGHQFHFHPKNCKPGDQIIVSGTIADHGIAILSVREGLEFGTAIKSDCAPLHDLVRAMIGASDSIRMLRDPTRGGVATVLNEIASSSGYSIIIEEDLIPVRDEVAGACELLGFDPLYVANEGKLIAVVSPDHCDRLLAAMHQHPLGQNAVRIGCVSDKRNGIVGMKSRIGGQRIVDMLSGEQLPRIC